MKNSIKLVELLNKFRKVENALFGLVCALVIGIFAWSAESGFQELSSPRAEDSYYNLLVEGFRAGQLNVNREAPPGLSRLADPYDPAVNASYVWDTRHFSYEMSYYNGKLYLYFGATPALVLFWPYVFLTGHYLLHKTAVVIFFALGFLAAAGLLRAIWRRYFPKVNILAALAGVLALGFATGILLTLSSCDVYDVAKSCGFAFTMLALAAIWCALHEPKRQVLWLLLASLAYGLAIGSRPSLLFGGIILLIPLARTWHVADQPRSGRRFGLLLAAAAGPTILIGLGLMIYNALRFDNPFEFGWHYQLTSYNQKAAHQFSLHYLWFNFRFYFLQWMQWGSHFPFLQTVPPPPLPTGFWGLGEPYSGILINYPLVWMALAAPLAWSGRPMGEISALRWFVAVVVLLFMICALTMCLFFAASSRYEVEFLPVLMLLAVIGIFSSERMLARSPVRLRTTRVIWGLLLAYSVAFNILAGVESHASANYLVGNSFLHQGRIAEAVERYQKALALEPESATYQMGLGVAYGQIGREDEAIILFQKALAIEPNSAEVQYNFGVHLLQTGRGDEALVYFKRALEIEPDFPKNDSVESINNIAWSFATNPQDSQRNGAFSVKLAENACRRTHYQVTIMVGTLAAAYAAAGRFDDAILTARKACELARKNGETNLLQKNQELLTLYQNHRPYCDRQVKAGN